MRRTPRRALVVATTAVAATALALSLLPRFAEAATSQDAATPATMLRPLAIDLTMGFGGPAEAGVDGASTVLAVEGTGDHAHHQDGTEELFTTLSPSSFQADFGDLGPATATFEVASAGTAWSRLDEGAGGATASLPLEVTLTNLVTGSGGDRAAHPLSSCTLEILVAGYGDLDPTTGVAHVPDALAVASIDEATSPCVVDDGSGTSLGATVAAIFSGPGTGAVSLYTHPPEPPAVVEAEGGPLEAIVSWSAPAQTGGLPVESYRVEAVGTDHVTTTSGDVRSIDVIGLDPSATYQFQVVAETRLGPSNPSPASEPVTVRAPDIVLDDVGPGHPFLGEITWLGQSGVTTGYPDGTFRPDDGLSRQAMAAFLHRMAGEPEVALPATPTFSDVPVGSQFYEAVEWLAATGATGGYADGTFRPGEGLSRQAMAAFLYRVAGEPLGAAPVCAAAPFADVAVGQPFCGEVHWLTETGATTGYDDGTFRPTEGLSRQAMAAFLYRYLLAVPAPWPMGVPPDSYWDEMAYCETGGNWAHYPDGRWSGGLGIYEQTWDVWGGDEFAPNAGHATREEQIIVANRIATLGWGGTDPVGYSGWGCVSVVGYP